MIEIRNGISAKPSESAKLVEAVNSLKLDDGILYIGYPVLFAGGESTTLDALLITPKYGVVAFDIAQEKKVENWVPRQDILFKKIESMLIQYPSLNERRKFLVNLEVMTFAPNITTANTTDALVVRNTTELSDSISKLTDWNHSDRYETVVSIIQNVINLKAKINRYNVTRSDSRGGILKDLESKISNLDAEQEKAIIEFFDGVQRIRGLAGSGKTIVLALKAAYLHVQHPNWDIAVTFFSRALKQQFRDLIERFCIEKKGELPNWSKIKIMQSWGGTTTGEGMYRDFCTSLEVPFLSSKSAERERLSNNELNKTDFEFACEKALVASNGRTFEKYDAILVDEAQDLSNQFLKICYAMLRPPKRLIYAYDELQKLNEGTSLKAPSDLFGVEGQDIILNKCYRNSRPMLVTAHGLGFGINRDKGLVQFFDQPELWNEVGYSVQSGKLVGGEKVVLKRDHNASPEYLEKHSPIEDIIKTQKFSDMEQVAKQVAQEIKTNLEKDELLHKDIVIINPFSWTNKSTIPLFKEQLYKLGIKCHLAGDLDADIFYEEDSIAFTGIYRAKGNEAAMVYIINSDYCYSGDESVSEEFDLRSRRNILFTAITRSKAWVRLYGIGPKMDKLINEFNSIKANSFTLNFQYPTHEQIIKLNLIHRDFSQGEKDKILKGVDATKHLINMLDDLRSGKTVIENYPAELQAVLKKLQG